MKLERQVRIALDECRLVIAAAFIDFAGVRYFCRNGADRWSDRRLDLVDHVLPTFDRLLVFARMAPKEKRQTMTEQHAEGCIGRQLIRDPGGRAASPEQRFQSLRFAMYGG